jgi:hypothetical protein
MASFVETAAVASFCDRIVAEGTVKSRQDCVKLILLGQGL